MGTLTQKVQKALTTKDEIKSAITAHGVDVTDATPFSEYPAKISSIEAGIDTSDGTATASSLLSGKIAYSQGQRIVGNIPSRASGSLIVNGAAITIPAGYYNASITKSVAYGTQATPTISQSGTTITATCTQGAGYLSEGTKSATYTLPTAGAITGNLGVTSGLANSNGITGSGKVSITGVNQSAGWTSGYSNGALSVDVPAGKLYVSRTITPTTYEQTAIASEGIAYGEIKVAGDANLIPANIRQGASIFGVAGTAASGGAEFMDIQAPEGVRTFSIPWASTTNPRYAIGSWVDNCVLNGTPYPYFILSFAYINGTVICEYEDYDIVYHQTISLSCQSSGQWFIMSNLRISNLGFANGLWKVAIGN